MKRITLSTFFLLFFSLLWGQVKQEAWNIEKDKEKELEKFFKKWTKDSADFARKIGKERDDSSAKLRLAATLHQTLRQTEAELAEQSKNAEGPKKEYELREKEAADLDVVLKRIEARIAEKHNHYKDSLLKSAEVPTDIRAALQNQIDSLGDLVKQRRDAQRTMRERLDREKELRDKGNPELEKMLVEQYNKAAKRLIGDTLYLKADLDALLRESAELQNLEIDKNRLQSVVPYSDYHRLMKRSDSLIGLPYSAEVKATAAESQRLQTLTELSNRQKAKLAKSVLLLTQYCAVTDSSFSKVNKEVKNVGIPRLLVDFEKAIDGLLKQKDVQQYPYLVKKLKDLRSHSKDRNGMNKISLEPCN